MIRYMSFEHTLDPGGDAPVSTESGTVHRALAELIKRRAQVGCHVVWLAIQAAWMRRGDRVGWSWSGLSVWWSPGRRSSGLGRGRR